MANSPDLAFQKIIFAALGAALPTVDVVAHPEPDKACPYVQIGNSDVQEDNYDRFSLLTYVHFWSSKEGPHEVKQQQQALRDQLHLTDTTQDGWQFISIQAEFETVILDENNETWHGVSRYRAYVSSGT